MELKVLFPHYCSTLKHKFDFYNRVAGICVSSGCNLTIDENDSMSLERDDEDEPLNRDDVMNFLASYTDDGFEGNVVFRP